MFDSPLSQRIQSTLSLEGRTAVITGAGGGLGEEAARVLAEASAEVVCVDVVPGRAEAIARELTDGGLQARHDHLDVTKRDEVQVLFDRVERESGSIDVLGNAAGIINHGEIADVPESDYDAIFAVNIKGTFLACQAVAPRMVARQRGSIINVSSGAIDAPSRGRSAYAMTKAAVAQLARNLAMELSPDGVRVNAIAPGFFPSFIAAQNNWVVNGQEDPELKARKRAEFADAQALPALGEAFDQAMLVLYLASDASRFVTGQIFRANGGLAMPW